MEFRRVFMRKYYDYFQEQEHNPDEVTMDEFIAEAMRTDLKFNTLAEELQYQRTSRITLMNEREGRTAFLCIYDIMKAVY